jgi:hypothetical protein
MTELGSMRQVLIWFRQNNVCLPVCSSDGGEAGIIWKLPLYQNIQAILSNPVYAGAYAFGKTETRTKVVDGRAHKRSGFRRPRSQWMVLTSPRLWLGTGRALLSGLLRCRRCGRML